MSRRTTIFLYVLVTFNSHILIASAAPLDSQFPIEKHVPVTLAIVSADASTIDVDTSHNPHRNFRFARESFSGPTAISWETVTATAKPTMALGAIASARPARWVLPETFTDLSPFGITRPAFGLQNIGIATGIPATASASKTAPSATPSDSVLVSITPLPRAWTNDSSAYRLFYPSGSIDPGNRPQGGAGFYATPGNLSFAGANNVTLEYSIFFPADFDWVHGGKLPGLYGGHKGCSGGNSAINCFSTRLMWRTGGAGELYLYAPKDKQTAELCNAPPKSACDAAYGLSVGRGSFHFAAGEWTHVSQTVWLNTPGRQDGGFELLVNGQLIMRRNDVFYRDNPHGGSGDDVRGFLRQNLQARTSFADLLQSLLPFISQIEGLGGQLASLIPSLAIPPSIQNPTEDIRDPTRVTKTVTLTTTVTVLPSVTPLFGNSPATSFAQVASQFTDDDTVGFSGIFFSTFFGGHEKSWASPKDQYAWFKDFGVSLNS